MASLLHCFAKSGGSPKSRVFMITLLSVTTRGTASTNNMKWWSVRNRRERRYRLESMPYPFSSKRDASVKCVGWLQHRFHCKMEPSMAVMQRLATSLALFMAAPISGTLICRSKPVADAARLRRWGK